MADDSVDIFTCSAEFITASVVSTFVQQAIATRVQAESLVVEFKRARNGLNVIEAVAAMANTDGGIVILGVDPDEADPIIGVEAKEIDSVSQQLRAHLGSSAMPEVIPVALPSSSRAVLVLRVDADSAETPVVVNGRVLVRSPGESAGARRDEVIALVDRGRNQTAAPYAGTIPMDVGMTVMWDQDPPVAVEVRSAATWLLPRRVTLRPWLGSSARASVAELLQQCPIPSRLRAKYLRPHEAVVNRWYLVESAAGRLFLRSDLNPAVISGRYDTDAALRVSLNGRSLQALVAIRLHGDGKLGVSHQLELEAVHELLLAACYVVDEIGVTTSVALEASDPVSPPLLCGWIGGELGINAVRLERDWDAVPSSNSRPEYPFRPLRPTARGLTGLHGVVIEWLEPLLFDLGASGFDAALAKLQVPSWAI